MRAGQSEKATAFEADAALREALLGRVDEVPVHANAALGIPTSREVKYPTALSLALAGDVSRAQSLADDLARSYPDDTLVQFNYLPAIRAQIALSRRDPPKAIDLLQSATPHEFSDAWWRILGPIYVRGEAYLMAHRGLRLPPSSRSLSIIASSSRIPQQVRSRISNWEGPMP